MEETLVLILDELKNIKNDIAELKAGQARLEAGQAEIKTEQNKMKAEQDEMKAELEEMKATQEEIISKLDNTHLAVVVLEKEVKDIKVILENVVEDHMEIVRHSKRIAALESEVSHHSRKINLVKTKLKKE